MRLGDRAGLFVVRGDVDVGGMVGAHNEFDARQFAGVGCFQLLGGDDIGHDVAGRLKCCSRNQADGQRVAGERKNVWGDRFYALQQNTVLLGGHFKACGVTNVLAGAMQRIDLWQVFQCAGKMGV